MVSKPMYRLTEAFPYLVTRVGVRMGGASFPQGLNATV